MIGFIGGLNMNKILLVLCIIISLVISCSLKGNNIEKGNDSITSKSSEGQITPSNEVINLTVDLEKERELQREVDRGHQPWRLEPIDVAHSTLITTVDKDVAYENCILVTEKGSESVVKCEGTRTYIVYLKRIVRENGIWTALQIEIKQ
jgi:hypothetical protein